jgi:hypothetical protein
MGAAALPAIVIGATVLSTATAAYGQIQQGQAAKSQADYQAAVARNNSIIAEQKAEDAIARGAIEEQQRRELTQQRISKQRASAAARGVEADSGSALALIEDEAGIGELDALTIRQNAAREASGLRYQGQQFSAEGQLLESTGKSARRASTISAGGTLLSGASKVAGKWYDYGG